MRRREFIGLIGAAALSFPPPGKAQTDTGLPVVGFLVPFKEDADFTKERIAAVRKGLFGIGFHRREELFLGHAVCQRRFGTLAIPRQGVGRYQPTGRCSGSIASREACKLIFLKSPWSLPAFPPTRSRTAWP